MANYTNLNDLFTDLANAIRVKTNSTAKIIADNFPTEIESLKSGFDYNNQEVTSIPDYAFYGCEDLKSVDCYNLTSVGASAFENCANLNMVVLYDGATDVGENAFKGCDCVIYYKAASIPETWHENWNPDNCLVLSGEPVETWDVLATEEDNVTAELYGIGGEYVLYIHGSGNIVNYTLDAQPWNTYKGDITNIVIADSVTSIGAYAFYNCTNLTSITIPDSVTNIGSYAFANCSSLTSIAIPDSVTSIGYNAFANCSGLTSITIPDRITIIMRGAFYKCSGLTSVVIPDSVTYIDLSAFRDCTSLTSITIPDSVTSIGGSAFQGCINLTSITIPDRVTIINDETFNRCTSLTYITIPDSVTSIGDYAFKGCTNLTSITYTGTIAKWNTMRFGSSWNTDTGTYTIHCTDGDIAKDGTITYH